MFEYATNKNTALYGSVPLMLAHSERATIGVLWLNPTGAFIDIYDQEGATQSTQW